MSRKIGLAAVRSDNGLLLLLDLVTLLSGRLVLRVVRPGPPSELGAHARMAEISGELYIDVLAELVGPGFRWQVLEKLSPVLVVFYVDPQEPDESIEAKLVDLIDSVLNKGVSL